MNMKRNILIIGALAFAAFGLQSCLDYDDPGSEMGKNQVINDDEKFEGNVDLIDYKVQCSEDGFNAELIPLDDVLSVVCVQNYE